MSRPVLEVAIGNQTLVGGPWKMEIPQQENGLDVCVLSIPRTQASPVLYAKNTPVLVTWGRSRAFTSSFPGYIEYVDNKRGENTGEARIVCLGAGAQKLRDAASRVWPVGSSADIAVQQIADTLHLSSLTEPTAISAPGGPINESWWNYIRRAANETGFFCSVAGTDIRFHSRRIDSSGDGVPFFIGYSDVKVRSDNAVYSYDATDADDDAGLAVKRKRRAFGITDEGVSVRITDSGDLESVGGKSQFLPTLTRNENFVAHDMGTALDKLRAVQENNRFTRQSKFIVSGDETVRPGSTVVIRGIRDDLDGYWYVLRVVHRVSSAAYSMELYAGRDGIGDSAPANLTAAVPVIDLGRGEPVPAPAASLVRSVATSADLVFPTTGATWTASRLLHRKHYPWRAAVRG